VKTKTTAFFADGMQDDILTKLAKISDLKDDQTAQRDAIPCARNTRQIGEMPFGFLTCWKERT